MQRPGNPKHIFYLCILTAYYLFCKDFRNINKSKTANLVTFKEAAEF